jgi:hypothetical protein
LRTGYGQNKIVPFYQIGQEGVAGGLGQYLPADKSLEYESDIANTEPLTSDRLGELLVSRDHREPMMHSRHKHEFVDLRE